MTPRHFRHFCFCACFLAGLAGTALAGGALGISAPAFASGKPIPAQYAFAVKNISPELRIANVPANAKALALIADDPDAPAGLWTHWLVWNLPANTTSIPEGKLPPEAREGKNSNGHARYDGPAPPRGTGVHRYFFRLFALDVQLPLPAGSDRATLEAAMKGHIVATGETFGIYQHGPALPE